MQAADGVPEIDLSDPRVALDPFRAYGAARERAPLARLPVPGMLMWAVTRYGDARAMLADERFELTAASFSPPPVPDHCKPYMRTMTERPAPEHARLRRLVSPAFTARRAADFRPRIEPLADALLDALPGHAENGVVDLLRHFAQPLPMDVICELVGIPEPDRPRWREYGATVAAVAGREFASAVPGIIDGAVSAVASRRARPDQGLLSTLLHVRSEDGDRLGEAELVTLVWHLVMAGQTPANLIGNAVGALLAHPAQLAALRADPALVPDAVEELIRWCGPTLLSVPRYAREDLELLGTPIAKGEAVTAAIASANRDPRAFTDPGRLDVTRPPSPGHLGFGHGPHFCLGASFARVQTEVALTALLDRFPDLAPAVPLDGLRAPDPGTWRLTSLPVSL